MGKRKYPPLTPAEVKAIVLALGFSYKRTKGAHAHYERSSVGKFQRAIVTIDEHYKEFDDDLIKNMISQSGHDRDQQYSLNKPWFLRYTLGE